MDLTGIGGVWPATLTPFTPEGALDEGALCAHFAHLAAIPGVRALVVNGHAGEATALDLAERHRVVALARATLGAETGLVAGVAAENTRQACALARDAAEAGADALLLFPPPAFAGGSAARPEAILAFARAVAEAGGKPLVLFQLSRASGLGYTAETLRRLCTEIPSVIAVKEGSDLPAGYDETRAVLAALGRPVTLLTSNNTALLGTLACGGDGILSGLGSVAAPLLVDLDAAIRRGDLAAARAAHERMLPLVRAFYRAPGMDIHNRMKTALHLMGLLPHPEPRPPLQPLMAEERAAIGAALREAGLLPSPASRCEAV
ncbi:dihydrodipicolinate synthase family protein [Roseomonas sp. GC11]|uniref:dihydrodipicolinate synthase family protein n=1 Tax=Roseomonas sp. GC11 TaxID=2950546 RepID=UPI00210E6A66|nr:dihydrodipicolinate synthase family protein [Roseomonas sp. GC11]MCQ4160173.1 dihydrodipicolinate synthase family protein [Roseomonas sp. GC11]